MPASKRKVSLTRELREAVELLEQEQQTLFWMSTRICRKIEQLPARLTDPEFSEAHFLAVNHAVSDLNTAMTALKERLATASPAKRRRAPVLTLVRTI